MATPLKVFMALLLLFNGTGALFGGGQLIIHPDGSSLGLPLDLLKHSPFHDYFIPGIVLFFGNGLFSFFVIGAMFMNLKHYRQFIIAQGLILMGWIAVQIMIIRTVYQLHLLLGGTGLLLLLGGYLLIMLGRTEANAQREVVLRRS